MARTERREAHGCKKFLSGCDRCVTGEYKRAARRRERRTEPTAIKEQCDEA